MIGADEILVRVGARGTWIRFQSNFFPCRERHSYRQRLPGDVPGADIFIGTMSGRHAGKGALGLEAREQHV